MTVSPPRCSAIAAVALLVSCFLSGGAAAAQGGLSPALAAELAVTPAGEHVRVYAVMRAQASGTLVRRQAATKSLAARGTAVLRHLRDANVEAQAPFVDYLGSAAGVGSVKPHWIVNVVGFSGTPEAIAAAAARPEVQAINLDLAWVTEADASTAVAVSAPDGAEVGLGAIGAPAMWAKGYTGFGGISLTADTGVDPYHPALNHKYAGHDGRPGPWFTSEQYPEAADCGDHGTHVTGTILGLDAVTSDTIGVAPGAHWLGAAILCGTGTGDNLSVFEWALDPDADPATIADRPFVINNSWYDPSIEDVECTDANPYPQLLDNLQSAGVAVIFSAGNSGPEPRTITPPHSYNATLTNAFTVGALSGSRRDFPIADFSSRGPATCSSGGDEAIDIKPEVSAPGVNVRSAITGGGYGLKSGTSMAAPHTAGAALLLHEAFPDLDGDQILQALYYSAVDLGEPGEDNTYGRGIINVEAAYEYLVNEGNTPVPPSRPATAVEIVAADGASQSCVGTIDLAVTLRNPGTEAITSIGYDIVGAAAAAKRLESEVAIDPGAVVDLPIEVEYDRTGELTLSMRIVTINGAPADPRLDLGASWRVALTLATPPTLVVDREAANLCLGSPVTLSLEKSGEEAYVHFGTNPNANTIPGTAEPTFTLPALESATRLYGIAEYRRGGGVAISEGTDLSYVEEDEMTISFRALRPAILRQLTFVQASAARVRMEIRPEGSDEVIGRYNRRTAAGTHTVSIYAELAAQQNYDVTIVTISPLGFLPEVSLSDRPVEGFVEFLGVTAEDPAVIRGSSVLFDWVVGYYDGCEPTPVTLTPDTTRRASEREVGLATSVPVVGESFDAFDVASASGTAYTWTLADEVVEETGPRASLTPQRAGVQTVRMTLVDEGGCATAAEAEVDVAEGSSSTREALAAGERLRLWPNPTAATFSIAGAEAEVAAVSVLDAAGRTVLYFPSPLTAYPVDELPSGSYVVRVTGYGGASRGYSLEIAR